MNVLAQIKAWLEAPVTTLSGRALTVADLVTAVLIVAVARVLAGFVARAVLRVLERRAVDEGVRFAVAKIVHYVALILGVLVAADSVGLNLQALFAASAVILVGIGFGLQRMAENFIAGVILLFEQPVRKGDFIRVGDAFGWVVDIGPRATRVVTRDEVTIIVPNSELVGSQVINHATPTTRMRLAVDVGVAYGSDTRRVRDTLLEVAAADGDVLRDPAPEVQFTAFGDSSLDFRLLVWIANPAADNKVGSSLRFAIDQAFRERGVQIPFPQRDLHFKSGLEALPRG